MLAALTGMGNARANSGLHAHVPTRVGRYEIAGELGQGGMGAIYLGRAAGIGGFERLVAIKMIHRHLGREKAFIDMFLDEARIAASIRHPNVVSVFEVGEQDGRYYIAMDYVSGEPFSILLDRTWGRGIALPADLVAHVVAVASEGLHAAHELEDPSTGEPLGVVHRDVCPQNIMVGYDGTVRLMDFGVAKAAGQLAMTKPGTHKGKIPYMSPEHIRGKPIDRRSDVFAMGIVLWESTIGRRLFKDESELRSAARVLKGKIPRPSQIDPNYPPELEAIVLRALESKPARRYPTARALFDDLQRYLTGRRRLGAADVAALMDEHCGDRQRQKKEIERRASVDALVDGPIIDESSQQLFVGDEELPAHSIEEDEDALEEVSAVLLGYAGTPVERPEQSTQELDVGSLGFDPSAGAAVYRDTTRILGIEPHAPPAARAAVRSRRRTAVVTALGLSALAVLLSIAIVGSDSSASNAPAVDAAAEARATRATANGANANTATVNGTTPNSAPANGTTPAEATTKDATPNGAMAAGAIPPAETANGATANGATANGATPNGATANIATANGAPPNTATPNGATANGATANAAPPSTAPPNAAPRSNASNRDEGAPSEATDGASQDSLAADSRPLAPTTAPTARRRSRARTDRAAKQRTRPEARSDPPERFLVGPEDL